MIWGGNVNGSYRPIFSDPRFIYLAVDITPGPGVEVVFDVPDVLPFADGTVEIVLSGQVLEHSRFFWRTFREMVRVLHPECLILLIVPSRGPEHRYPVDCYRFLPDSMQALAEEVDCLLVESWLDRRGPWRDVVGVFSKTTRPAAPKLPLVMPMPPAPFPPSTPKEEAIKGGINYLKVLEDIHAYLAPRFYLEIGVRHGKSLRLARCPAVGVDPCPELHDPLPEQTRLCTTTSDEFLRHDAQEALTTPLDFAFIDGMHHFENVLRDFMHIEERAHPGTVVVIDDVLPVHPRQAERERATRVWTGDVWKIVPCLQRHRPDLTLMLLNTSPTGLLLVAGLNRSNTVLWNGYNPIVRDFGNPSRLPEFGVLERTEAIPPDSHKVEELLDCARGIRKADITFAQVRLAQAKGLMPTGIRLKLSVVVVAYNMACELPRTLASLSHSLQLDMSEESYEILVVDNGSTRSFDREACARLGRNISFHETPHPGPSPVRAANLGLRLARAELVGVFIDGARMASPRLLEGALRASRLHERAIIGACAFHLGHEVQMKSVPNGYDASMEDDLLAGSGWEKDPYRLFTISCFADSSSKGLFVLPAETNSLFMRRAQWEELGGYDEAFASTGGLCNLDVWKRSPELPCTQPVLLLGEGTFHQVHGGVATNGAGMTLAMCKEYRRIRGCDFTLPVSTPLQLGHLHPLAQWTMTNIAAQHDSSGI